MKKTITLLFPILFLISCSKEEPKTVGSIFGMITSSINTEPIRGASIELYNPNSYGSGKGTLLLKTVTYDDGHYDFEDLLPGIYFIQASANGYVSKEYKVEVITGNIARADLQLSPVNTYLTVVTLGTSEEIGGEIILYGKYSLHAINYPVSEFGFLYGKNPNLNLNNSTLIKGEYDNGTFYAYLNALGTGKWYYQAYAKNTYGYEYGNIMEFDITGNPVISTLKTTNISENTATLNGEIIYSGDPMYYEKGFVYSYSFNNPTIDDPSDISSIIRITGNSKYFSSNISNLKKDTTYYVRAYATNENGTVYGETVIFNTSIQFINIDNLDIQLKDLSEGTTFDQALSLCRNSNIGGYKDWTLPTLGELSLLYKNREKIGNFSDSEYWTSTKHSSDITGTYYYAIDFKTGETVVRRTDRVCNVRALRLRD